MNFLGRECVLMSTDDAGKPNAYKQVHMHIISHIWSNCVTMDFERDGQLAGNLCKATLEIMESA